MMTQTGELRVLKTEKNKRQGHPTTVSSSVTFGQICHFCDPNLVSFYIYELTYLLYWLKNTLLFICSTNILVCLLTINMKNCLTQKNPKMSVPILVTLLKMRPHYSQSRHENVTPSSGTSPLASYKEVPPSGLLYRPGGATSHTVS